jgi:hypothetical protein
LVLAALLDLLLSPKAARATTALPQVLLAFI